MSRVDSINSARVSTLEDELSIQAKNEYLNSLVKPLNKAPIHEISSNFFNINLGSLQSSPFQPVPLIPLSGSVAAPPAIMIPGSSASIGSIIDAASGWGTPVQIPDADRMPFWDQGDTNGCGTTSLSMVLNYYGINVSKDDIDKAIRRADNSLGATPQDEIEFARDHGLEAEGYNNGTWEDVKAMIDRGYPVMASVTGENTPELPGGTTLPDGRHQIVITGYQKGPDGKEYVLFHDPNYGDNTTGKGTEMKISVDDFKRLWGKEDFGVKNYYMVFAPKGTDLPAGNDDGAEGALGTLNGLVNITNGLDRIFSPDNFGSFVHGIPQFFGGLFQTVGCGVGALIQAGSSWLSNAVEGIPVVQNVVQPYADIFSGVGAGVADIFNGWGEAWDSVGGAFESLFNGDVGGFFEGAGDAVGDVAGGVVDAVGDVVSSVGDAISDFFSW